MNSSGEIHGWPIHNGLNSKICILDLGTELHSFTQCRSTEFVSAILNTWGSATTNLLHRKFILIQEMG